MTELELTDIRDHALNSNTSGRKWHFHVLTPSCKFNPKKLYAFALEIPEGNFVSYTESPPTQLGRELAPLMHKSDVLNQSSTEVNYRPSQEMLAIIDRAKALNEQGLEWHHHVTFKGCQFHTGQSEYSFVFDDPERGIVSIPFNEEPINDLKQIEPLFYSQHPKKRGQL